MATVTELLGALNTKEASVSTGDLASEIKATRETTLKQLTRELQKKNVSGSSQEGWLITDKGRAELEKGEIPPTMIDEGVTPRQQFEAKGRLIGIPEDRIRLATDIVWSGEYNDVIWVWEALGQADIADDLRSVWTNAWRAKLHKGIPPELETELTGVSKTESEAGEGVAPSKPGGRDFIIVDDEPVRVGQNLGDYSLQDAKDILALRALRDRFTGAGQRQAAATGGTGEKVSDLLRELAPYLNKGGNDETLRELLATQMELQRQEILSQIPKPGTTAEPKSLIEQITGFTTALGSLKEAGPLLRSILGLPESSGNPSTGLTGLPVSIKGPDGQPIVMDLGQVIDWRRFQGEERRADERHGALVGLAKTVRENIPDGVAALKSAAADIKGVPGAKEPAAKEEQSQVFSCGDCGTQFSAPAEWAGQPLKCPNPECGREYSKEELLG